MIQYPDPAIKREIAAEVIQLIREQCVEQGWSIESRQPLANNPDKQHVAHIRDNAGTVIGMGMSSESNALAIAEAFRSAWSTAFPKGDQRT